MPQYQIVTGESVSQNPGGYTACEFLEEDYWRRRSFLDGGNETGPLLLGGGNSANVVAACLAARQKGIKIIAMTGDGGGRLAEHADILLAVPSSVTMHIQESHIALGHAITLAVEQLLEV